MPRQVPVHGRLAARRVRAVFRFRGSAPRRTIASRPAALLPAWTPEPRGAAGSWPAAPLQHEPGARPDLISTRLQNRSCCATLDIRCGNTAVGPADVSASVLYTHVPNALASSTVMKGTSTCAAAPWPGPLRQRLPPRRRQVHAHDTSTPIRHSLGLTSRAGMACKRPRPAVCTVGSRQAPDTSRLLAVNIYGDRIALLGGRACRGLSLLVRVRTRPACPASGGLVREHWRERAPARAATRARQLVHKRPGTECAADSLTLQRYTRGLCASSAVAVRQVGCMSACHSRDSQPCLCNAKSSKLFDRQQDADATQC